MEEFDMLTIFLHYGATFTFRSGRVICNNETTLQFQYCAMSDGRTKHATFKKGDFAGWSITPKGGA